MGYSLSLPVFDGPLDLLLYLIRKNELDIFDIPISKINDEFVSVVEVMTYLNIDDISEFVVMSATLMLIKSKMLLPQEGENLAPEDDPRSDLVRRLLEYSQYKDAAASLEQKEIAQRDIFGRVFSLPLKQELERQLVNVNYFDLFTTFKEMLDRSKVQRFHEVVREEVSIGQKINELLDEVAANGDTSFFDFIMRQSSLMAKVVSFLAILELVKMKTIRIMQIELFGDIRIQRNTLDVTALSIPEIPADKM